MGVIEQPLDHHGFLQPLTSFRAYGSAGRRARQADLQHQERATENMYSQLKAKETRVSQELAASRRRNHGIGQDSARKLQKAQQRITELVGQEKATLRKKAHILSQLKDLQEHNYHFTGRKRPKTPAPSADADADSESEVQATSDVSEGKAVAEGTSQVAEVQEEQQPAANKGSSEEVKDSTAAETQEEHVPHHKVHKKTPEREALKEADEKPLPADIGKEKTKEISGVASSGAAASKPSPLPFVENSSMQAEVDSVKEGQMPLPLPLLLPWAPPQPRRTTLSRAADFL